MDKQLRQEGEAYLTKWGQGLFRLSEIQQELNNMKKNEILFNKFYKEENEEIFQAYTQLLEEKKQKLNEVLKNYKMIDDAILCLDDYKKEIIKLRYVYRNSWQSVALKSHTSIRHCFNIKNLAIDKVLENIYK